MPQLGKRLLVPKCTTETHLLAPLSQHYLNRRVRNILKTLMIRSVGKTRVSEFEIGPAIENQMLVVVLPELVSAEPAGLQLAPERRRRWESSEDEGAGIELNKVKDVIAVECEPM
jgi:hypothetical protein